MHLSVWFLPKLAFFLLLLASAVLLMIKFLNDRKTPVLLDPPQSDQVVVGKPGGQKTLEMSTPVATFNPYLTNEAGSSDICHQMFLGLIGGNPFTNEIEPGLAESWEISQDKCRYTIKLRQDLKWSDGAPLTSADVAFTYQEVVNNPQISSGYRDVFAIDDQFPQIEVLDQLTLCFTTQVPFVPFLRTLTAPILPKHVFEHKTRATAEHTAGQKMEFHSMWGLDCNLDEIVVSGPWKPSKFKLDQYLELEPNPHFCFKDAKGQALPYLEKMVYLNPIDVPATLKRFNTGKTDAICLNLNCFFEINQKNSRIYNLGPSKGSMFVLFNQSQARDQEGQPVVDPVKSSWFRNVAFRRAMAYAIDRSRLISDLYQGQAVLQTSYINRHSPYFNPYTPEYVFHRRKAQTLLTEAGFRQRNDGILYDPAGHPVVFRLATFGVATSLNDWICKFICADWAALGIQAEIEHYPLAQIGQMLDESLKWDAVMISMIGGNGVEPHFGINIWKLDGRTHFFNMGHPDHWQGQQPTQYSEWEIQMQSLYQEAAMCFEPERRKELYYQAQVLASEQLPFICLVNPLVMVAVSDRLGNVLPTINGGSNLNTVNWNSEQQFVL